MSQPFSDSEPGPFQKKGFLISAVFLVAVILVGAVVIFTGRDGGKDVSGSGGATPSKSAPASGSASAPATGDGTCSAFPHLDTAVPKAAPDAKGQLFRTVALPESSSAGPAVTDKDMKRCYAHSPAGALVAATQIGARSLLASNWDDVWERQTYGADKQGQLDMVRKAFEKSPPGDPAPGEMGQYAGFHFITYDNNLAVLDLLLRFQDGTLQVTPATMRWHGGDWQMEISNDSQRRNVQSQEGFTSWGAF